MRIYLLYWGISGVYVYALQSLTGIVIVSRPSIGTASSMKNPAVHCADSFSVGTATGPGSMWMVGEKQGVT